MTKAAVSVQEVMIYRTLKANRRSWLSNHELVAKTPDVADRTVRATTHRLAEKGILEVIEVSPGWRYRMVDSDRLSGNGYFIRLEAAEAVFFPEG